MNEGSKKDKSGKKKDEEKSSIKDGSQKKVPGEEASNKKTASEKSRKKETSDKKSVKEETSQKKSSKRGTSNKLVANFSGKDIKEKDKIYPNAVFKLVFDKPKICTIRNKKKYPDYIKNLEIGKEKIEGILTNGKNFALQFIPEGDYATDSKKRPDYVVYDKGFIVKHEKYNIVFYPEIVTIDTMGVADGWPDDLNMWEPRAYVHWSAEQEKMKDRNKLSVTETELTGVRKELAKTKNKPKEKEEADQKKKETCVAAAAVVGVAAGVGVGTAVGAGAAGVPGAGAEAGAGAGAAAAGTGAAGAGAGSAEAGPAGVAGARAGSAGAGAGAGAEAGAGAGTAVGVAAGVAAGAKAEAGATVAAEVGAGTGAGAGAGAGAGTGAGVGAGTGAGAGIGGTGAAGAGVGSEDGARGGAEAGTGAGAGAGDEKKVDDTTNEIHHAEKKTENDAATISKAELSKAQVEKVWWKRKWFICTIICLIIAIVAFVVITIITSCARGFHIPVICASSSSDAMPQLNETLSDPMNGTATGGSGAGNPRSTSSTTPTTTTTTRAYPAMTSIQRIPIKDLMKPTFEIVSATFLLGISSIGTSVVFGNTKVTYVLNITSLTNVMQLRCAYKGTGDIYLKDATGASFEITNKTSDISTRLLTLKLPKPVSEGTMKLDIPSYPLTAAFEKISFTCGDGKCSVFVNRKLSLLVPHFDWSTKHKWTINVDHPPSVTVVTNTKSTSTSTSTTTTFQETAPILPSELSLVIMENFSKQASGTKVQYYLPSGTEVKEATGLIQTMEKGLASNTKPSIPSGEMFVFILLPAMEKDQFCGRNVALIGTSLLRSNMEIQQKFVWNFIFRTVVYNKVISADKKSTWVYEQSAVFLSTSVKSTNKHLWKKHYYETVMNNGRDDMKAPVNQSIVYEDEHRYLHKFHHVAKVSTILAMFVTVNNDTSNDPLTILDTVRSNEISSHFFFIKSQLKLENGVPVDVERVVSCYVDNPVTPRLHIHRISPTHVAIRRSSGGPTDGCDVHVWLDKGRKNGITVNKEHKVLSGNVEKVEVEAVSPILLSGETPFSAYAYTMEQTEFDRLLDVSVVNSYDDTSLNMLASNAFDAAADGILSYESLVRFMKLVLSLKSVSVDEAVDMWMLPVTHSRNEMLTNVIEKIVASVINDTGASDSVKVTEYTVARFQKSLKDAPAFEIEQAKKLMRNCGKPCLLKILADNYETEDCIAGKVQGCSYVPSSLEIYACLKMATGDSGKYDQFVNLYKNCTGKPCLLPILRGLLCTKNSANLEKWLSDTTTMDITDVVDRQVVQAVFHGLASNDVSKPLLFPYLMENWHLIHQKFAVFPALLGDIVVSMTSTISSPEQLVEFKQFIAYHGDRLSMFREFQEEAERAEKAIEWNKKFADVFRKLFD